MRHWQHRAVVSECHDYWAETKREPKTLNPYQNHDQNSIQPVRLYFGFFTQSLVYRYPPEVPCIFGKFHVIQVAKWRYVRFSISKP